VRPDRASRAQHIYDANCGNNRAFRARPSRYQPSGRDRCSHLAYCFCSPTVTIYHKRKPNNQFTNCQSVYLGVQNITLLNHTSETASASDSEVQPNPASSAFSWPRYPEPPNIYRHYFLGCAKYRFEPRSEADMSFLWAFIHYI